MAEYTWYARELGLKWAVETVTGHIRSSKNLCIRTNNQNDVEQIEDRVAGERREDDMEPIEDRVASEERENETLVIINKIINYAETAALEVVKKAGLSEDWHVDSAAIADWNVNCPPEPRALSTMVKHGRQIQEVNFQEFDYIFGMDESNIKHFERLAPKNCKAEILLLSGFGLRKNERVIADPYFVSKD
uniref:protein-tyrosine-phosphatase n=1 Tax=Glossina palpalis gambiensis TaxID=67801 RepID=A0A1B0C2K5_9MUSC